MVSANDGRVITFYSYKGGTGRSMALAHAAWISATRGYRVLAIDWDLEAPGLHRYFAPFLEDRSVASHDGLIDFLLSYCDGATGSTSDESDGDDGSLSWVDDFTDIWRCAQPVRLPGIQGGGRLDFVSAGRQDEMYATRVGLYRWQHFYSQLGGGAFLNRVRHECISVEAARAAGEGDRPRYDFVFIDSRTGLSDTSGICTAQLPDCLVCLFTYNVQSIEGASRVVRKARAMREELAASSGSTPPSPGASPRGALRIIPVPSRAEKNDTTRLSRMRDFAVPYFREFLDSSCESSSDPRQSLIEVELPYITDLSYNEVLALQDAPTDPGSYLGIMHRLASRISPDRGNDSVIALDPSVARSMWVEYQDVLEAGAPSAPRQAAASESAVTSRSVDQQLQSLLNSETDAGRISVRRVIISLVCSGAERGLTSENTFAPYALFELRQSERDAAERLVRDGLLCVRFDPAMEGRVISPVNDDALRDSATVKAWLSDFAEVIRWKRELGMTFARATNGLAEDVRLSDEVYESCAGLEKSFWEELNPREQRIWKIARDRKRAEAETRARLEASQKDSQSRLDNAKADMKQIRGRLRETRRYALAGLVASLVLGVAFSGLFYDRSRTRQQLARSTQSTAAWEKSRKGDFNSAIATFDKLIVQYHDDPSYRIGRAYARARLLGSGRPGEDQKEGWRSVTKDAEDAIKLQDENGEPVDPSSYIQLAKWYEASGEKARAVDTAQIFLAKVKNADNAANFVSDVNYARNLINEPQGKRSEAVTSLTSAATH